MSLQLILVALSGTASLVLIGLALRENSRGTVLARRLEQLATPGASLAPARDRAEAMRPLEMLLLCTGKDRIEIGQTLRAAGYYQSGAVAVFAALRLAATLLGGGLTALVLWRIGWLHGIWRIQPFAAAGMIYVLSKSILRSRIAARTRRVGKELPFVLDVMLLMLESGVSLDQCFRHIAQSDLNAAPNVRLATGTLVDDLQKGMAYETALDRWADRLEVDGSAELAGLFSQALLHGTELAPALRAFSREFAERRVNAARETIGKKTTQMTVVMIVFLMPALMIVVAGPAMSAVFHAMGQLQ